MVLLSTVNLPTHAVTNVGSNKLLPKYIRRLGVEPPWQLIHVGVATQDANASYVLRGAAPSVLPLGCGCGSGRRPARIERADVIMLTGVQSTSVIISQLTTNCRLTPPPTLEPEGSAEERRVIQLRPQLMDLGARSAASTRGAPPEGDQERTTSMRLYSHRHRRRLLTPLVNNDGSLTASCRTRVEAKVDVVVRGSSSYAGATSAVCR